MRSVLLMVIGVTVAARLCCPDATCPGSGVEDLVADGEAAHGEFPPLLRSPSLRWRGSADGPVLRGLAELRRAQDPQPTPPGLPGGVSRQMQALIASIKANVDPEYWRSTSYASIGVIGATTLVVRASPEMQERVARYVDAWLGWRRPLGGGDGRHAAGGS